MKAIIKKVNHYKIEINGMVYDDFEKCDEWEGMLKFKNKHGVVIVSCDDFNFQSFFSNLFNNSNKDEPVEFDIVRASPNFIKSAVTNEKN